MDEKIKKIILNYAHDYRDMDLSEFQLEEMLINFMDEVLEVQNESR